MSSGGGRTDGFLRKAGTGGGRFTLPVVDDEKTTHKTFTKQTFSIHPSILRSHMTSFSIEALLKY